MDTKDTTEKTAPPVAPARPAPKPRPSESEPEERVPSVPLSGLGDDFLEDLGAAFSGLSVGGPEGKEKEKEKEAVDITFDFTGHKVAKPRILSKWLTELTHLCCVLSLF